MNCSNWFCANHWDYRIYISLIVVNPSVRSELLKLCPIYSKYGDHFLCNKLKRRSSFIEVVNEYLIHFDAIEDRDLYSKRLIKYKNDYLL